MIMIDVYVPAVNNTYDFKVDENVSISMVIEEILGILSKEIMEQPQFTSKGFALCDVDQGRVLPCAGTLRGCGITNGKKLILV